MNGRIYDPKLGRFLQADPIVQAPKNSQSLNRYSYVLNNPLSYTDPSGYFIKELALFVAAVARVVYTWEDPSAWVYLAVSAKNLFNGMGSQQSGLPTGATAGAFANGFTTATSFNTSGAQHDAGYPPGDSSNGVIAATVGGTGSNATGWKFANGAISAGLAYAIAAGGASSARRLHGGDNKFGDKPEGFQNQANAALEELRQNPEFAELEANSGSKFTLTTDVNLGTKYFPTTNTININPDTLNLQYQTSLPDEWVDIYPDTHPFSLKRSIYHEAYHSTQDPSGLHYLVRKNEIERQTIMATNDFMWRNYRDPLRAPKHNNYERIPGR